jgi:hypothetical protein
MCVVLYSIVQHLPYPLRCLHMVMNGTISTEHEHMPKRKLTAIASAGAPSAMEKVFSVAIGVVTDAASFLVQAHTA